MAAYSFSTNPSETIAVLLASPSAQAAMALRGIQPAAQQAIAVFLRPCARNGAVVWECMQSPHTTYDHRALAQLTTNWLLLTDQHTKVPLLGQAVKTVRIDAIADADIAQFIDFLLRHYDFDAVTTLTEHVLDDFLLHPRIRYASVEVRCDSSEQFQADIDRAFDAMAPLLQSATEYAHVVLEGEKGKLRLSMGRYIQQRLTDYPIGSLEFSSTYSDHAAPAMQCHFLLSH
jgi:hypothetical protein